MFATVLAGQKFVFDFKESQPPEIDRDQGGNDKPKRASNHSPEFARFLQVYPRRGDIAHDLKGEHEEVGDDDQSKGPGRRRSNHQKRHQEGHHAQSQQQPSHPEGAGKTGAHTGHIGIDGTHRAPFRIQTRMVCILHVRLSGLWQVRARSLTN